MKNAESSDVIVLWFTPHQKSTNQRSVVVPFVCVPSIGGSFGGRGIGWALTEFWATSPSPSTIPCTKPGTRPPTSTCWSSWSASACSCTPEKTSGRSCASSRCLPPLEAARSPTSTTACRRSVCASSWRCTLWLENLNSSNSRARQRVCNSQWNERRTHSFHLGRTEASPPKDGKGS